MTITYSDGTISLLKRWKGSVYKSVLFQLVSWLFLWYLVRLIYFYALDADQQLTFERIVRTFGSNIRSSFALTFILGFYVSTIVGRWWSQINLIVWPDDLVSFTGFIFSDGEKSSKIRRHQISRYLVLSCALVFRDISIRVKKRLPTLEHVVRSGLMTPEECLKYQQCGEDSGRWMLPLEWVGKIIRQRLDEGKVPPPICGSYLGKLSEYRTNLRQLYLYDWICVPLVYTQVAAIATYSYFALALIGRQYLIHNDDSNEIDLWFPIFTVLEFLFYVGWFKVGQELMKPWGEDDDDAELNYILDRHLRVAFSISDLIGDQACPPPIEDKFWYAPNSLLLHTISSKKINEHPPKSFVKLPKKLDPKLLEMADKIHPMKEINMKPQSLNRNPYVVNGSEYNSTQHSNMEDHAVSHLPEPKKRNTMHF